VQHGDGGVPVVHSRIEQRFFPCAGAQLRDSRRPAAHSACERGGAVFEPQRAPQQRDRFGRVERDEVPPPRVAQAVREVDGQTRGADRGLLQRDEPLALRPAPALSQPLRLLVLRRAHDGSADARLRPCKRTLQAPEDATAIDQHAREPDLDAQPVFGVERPRHGLVHHRDGDAAAPQANDLVTVGEHPQLEIRAGAVVSARDRAQHRDVVKAPAAQLPCQRTRERPPPAVRQLNMLPLPNEPVPLER
jgi:hypothetical protein